MVSLIASHHGVISYSYSIACSSGNASRFVGELM
jgi:hypothetical protein